MSGSRWRVVTLGSGVLALAALACGGEKPREEAPQAAPGQAPATEAAAPAAMPAGGATVSGTVKFTGTAPQARRIDMSEEPACAEKYPQGAFTQEVVANPNGTLGNVFVYVKEGLPAGASYPAPAQPVVLDQDGCRYHPHVLGIQVGQSLEILNSDPLLHNINAKPTKQRGFNISQPVANMKTTRKFTTMEIMVPVECDVHGWMKAYIGVLQHPFFAVTGDQGGFAVKGLAAGTYVIEAWHEKYGTQTQTVTVADGQQVEVNFTFGTPAA